MSTFVLIPGAGGTASFWSRVVPLLEAAGHEAIAVNLPGDDESAGLPEYAGLVTAAIGRRRDVVLVAQSMGGFTAPMVCTRVPVSLLVLVNAMIPQPGETPGAWWGNTGSEEARIAAARDGGYPAEMDLDTYFLHDLPAEALASGELSGRPEADIAFGKPCAIARWPDVPTRVISGRDDRFFPLEFQRRLAKDRLGLDVDVVPGGHLAALSHPAELTAQLTSYLNEPGSSTPAASCLRRTPGRPWAAHPGRPRAPKQDQGAGLRAGIDDRDGELAGTGVPGRQLDPGDEAELGHQVVAARGPAEADQGVAADTHPWHGHRAAAGRGRDVELHVQCPVITLAGEADLQGQELPVGAERAVDGRARAGQRDGGIRPVARSSTRTWHSGAHRVAQATRVALAAMTPLNERLARAVAGFHSV